MTAILLSGPIFRLIILVKPKVHHKTTGCHTAQKINQQSLFGAFYWPLSARFSANYLWASPAPAAIFSPLMVRVNHVKKENKRHLRQLLLLTTTKHYLVNLNAIIWNVVSTRIDFWQPEVKGPGLCSGVWRSLVGWDSPEDGGSGRVGREDHLEG